MNATSPLRLAPLGAPSRSHAVELVGPRPAASCRAAIFAARQWLLDEQRDEGSWCGRQEADASLTARWLLLQSYRNRGESDHAGGLAHALLQRQLPGGGWPARPGEPADLSATVLCYLALKLWRGADALADLRDAKRLVCEGGGALRASGEAAAWLELFGQAPRFELVHWASGAATRRVSPLNGVGELLVGEPSPEAAAPGPSSRAIDLIWRRVALGACESEAGIALHEELDALIDPEFGLMPDQSPATDTALAATALLTSGLDAGSRTLAAACDRLTEAATDLSPPAAAAALRALTQEVRLASRGDLPPSLNLFRDETDDSLSESNRGEGKRRLRDQLIGSQNGDGGWADLPEDGSSPLATAEVLLALGDEPSITSAAAAFLRRRQAVDGGWALGSDASSVTATSRVLLSLLAAGVDAEDSAVLAGVNWLLANQDESGGWGDADSSVADAQQWGATVTHTAAAVEALTAAGFGSQLSVARAVDFLIETQDESGRWLEPHFAEGGPSRGGWRRNELRPAIAALQALSRWSTSAAPSSPTERRVCLRLVGAGTVEG